MSITSKIMDFLTHQTKADTAVLEAGYCPNCWGRQEYGGKFYEAAKAKQFSINDKDEHVGWIQEYADKHLSDIRLAPAEDGLICDKCTVAYRPEN